MNKFGFNQPLTSADFTDLPKKKPAVISEEFADEAEKLGFSDRTTSKKQRVEKKNRTPGRKPPEEPKMRILISGPETTMLNFKRYCERNGNLPYWKALADLLEGVNNQ